MDDRVRGYGLAGALGGALFTLYTVPDLIAPETFSGTGPVAYVYGASMVLLLASMLVGLVGLHVRLRPETGRLERAGYYVSLAGFVTALLAELYGYGLVETGLDPFGTGDVYFIVFILSLFAAIVGSALVGVAGLRTGRTPDRVRAVRPLSARYPARVRAQRHRHRDAVRRDHGTLRRRVDGCRLPSLVYRGVNGSKVTTDGTASDAAEAVSSRRPPASPRTRGRRTAVEVRPPFHPVAPPHPSLYRATDSGENL